MPPRVATFLRKCSQRIQPQRLLIHMHTGPDWALELHDVTGAKRALSLPSPTKPAASEAALTPHYEEEALS